jgi:hypothetical protein
MPRPFRALALFATLWIGSACLEPVSPIQPIFSLTTVLLPFPSIAQKDTMRDTLGQVKPLRVIGFNAKGDTVDTTLYTVTFLAIDSTNQLKINPTTGIATGDTISPFAKVVGTVTLKSNSHSIQTLAVNLPVVPRPAMAVRDTDFSFVWTPPSVAADSTSSGLISPPLNVTVYASTRDTVVLGWVVSYQIVYHPPSVDSQPTVVLYDPSGHDSTISVTNTSGVASRALRIRPGAFVSASRPDSVLVAVRVQFHGNPLPVAVSDTFTIKLQENLLSTSINAYPRRNLRGILRKNRSS